MCLRVASWIGLSPAYLKPIQRRQPSECGQPRFGTGAMPDNVDALSKLAISQRASGCAQRLLDRVELMQHFFTRCAGLDHADDGAQVPLGGAQAIDDRMS